MSQLSIAQANLRNRSFPAATPMGQARVVPVDTALQVVSLVVDHYEGEIERLNEVIKQYRVKEMQQHER